MSIPPAVNHQPLELILARNLAAIVSVPAAVIDAGGHVVFYNDAASASVGSRFEETGPLTRERWNSEAGPYDEDGRPVPYDELPLTIAVREGRPAYARLRVRIEGALIEVEVAAVPLIGPAGYHGALVVFWPLAREGS
jgi:PAS domain-containing protein